MPKLTIAVFFFAFGACVGSLVNVLVYRLPLGLDPITPSSRCPSCDTKLTWRENIPIFGWLMLGGRCRFCRSKISHEYPIVETIVAVMYAGLYLVWYALPEMSFNGQTPLGVNWGVMQPEWAANGLAHTWPIVVTTLVLFSCLVAATLIDARTYTIPLELTWVPACVAVVLLTGHAVWMGIDPPYRWFHAEGWGWSLATPGPGGWRWAGTAVGGVLGLGVSLLLMRAGLIRQSFADYEAWEKEHLAQQSEQAGQDEGAEQAEQDEQPGEANGDADGGEGAGGGDAQVWVQYPFARREMVKELAFLCPPVVLGLGLGWAAERAAYAWGPPAIVDPLTGAMTPGAVMPGWLMVLSGVLLGYLIGGGLVWGVRVLGSLAFGKEAMGLGDVHLMAGVGACVGWIDPTVAFFVAAFLALLWEVLRRVVSRRGSGMLPYGPYLAVATVLVVVGKPVVEWGLGALAPAFAPFDLP